VERAVVITEGDEIRPAELPPCVQARREAPAAAEDFRAQMARHEAQVIREALARAGGNRTAAAQLLGMPRRTLFHKIQALGLKGEGG
jgi:DNA-binding NtrC family response regulator